MRSEHQTRLPVRRLLPLFATLATLPLSDSGRVLGQLILGAPGAGKTILESLILLVDLLRGLPGCVLDPLGTLSDAFLFRLSCFLSEFPKGGDESLWQRLCYIELGRPCGISFPLYYLRPGETLFDAGNRLITVLERSNPQLVTGSPLTWPAARRLALNAGMLFTSLREPGLVRLEDLLFNTIEWQKSGRFDEAIRRNPQAKDAVSYFQTYYLSLPRSEKSRITGTLLDQVSPLIADPTLRGLFGGEAPGLDWEEPEAKRRLVLINGKGISDPHARLFASHWILESLFGHLRKRGRRSLPFVLVIDEFAHLAGAGTTDNKPVADLFDEFLAQYARNNRVFVTAALQSVDQVDERLARTLFRMGTLITGRAGSVREARTVADHLFRKDINRVQHYKKVWGKVDPPPYIPGYGRGRSFEDAAAYNPFFPYFVLDYEPQFMGLDLQTEEAAGRIQKLPALEFLCRRAVSEGTVSEDVIPLTLAQALIDPDTGEYQFPDPEYGVAFMTKLQQRLAKRTGIPSAAGEGSERQRGTTPIERESEEVRGSQTSRLPDSRTAPDIYVLPVPLTGHKPEKTRNETKSEINPALSEQEHAFLTYLCDHPDVPITSVYQAVGLSGRKGQEIRGRLRELGLIQELEIRTPGTGKGRPMKFVLPTLQAVEYVGQDPPKGRGGMIHRHIQQIVKNGAIAKGYKTVVEYVLDSGAIVDVHLENGTKRIAVEIAITSTPERESTHIRNCLAAGYDQVYGLFADGQLLAQTAQALEKVCPADGTGTVRLLPLSHLAQLG